MQSTIRRTVLLALFSGLAVAACSSPDAESLFATGGAGPGSTASSGGGEGGAPGEGGASGNGGAPGEGGAGGTGGDEGPVIVDPPVCGDTYVDCDGNEENGCEVNVMGDALHCGTCPVPCRGSCQEGTCVQTRTHAMGQHDPLYIAVAGGDLFWTNGEEGSVMQWSHETEETTVIASDQVEPAGIKADATHVFWVTQGDRDPYTGAVVRARRGSDEAPVVVAAAQTAPFGLALDGEFVYWTNREGGGAVVRARKDSNGNGPFTTIWGDAGAPHAVIVDATHVYWTVLPLDDGDGRVMAAPKDSKGEGPFTTIATAQGEVREIALDGTYVYWTTSSSGTVMRAPKVGGQGEVTALVTGAPNPRGIVADRSGVYWTDPESVNIMKIWPNGVQGTFVAREASPYGIALDAERVYWTNGLGSNGTIESAPK
ncbi:hypothetical protein [Sorangium sp. So ce1151]|uniref:hypothetical protein n=1 Tax=Sorangium sp. So ce1151 TaxID=3133332 RepID=UPI003F5F67D4